MNIDESGFKIGVVVTFACIFILCWCMIKKIDQLERRLEEQKPYPIHTKQVIYQSNPYSVSQASVNPIEQMLPGNWGG